MPFENITNTVMYKIKLKKIKKKRKKNRKIKKKEKRIEKLKKKENITKRQCVL